MPDGLSPDERHRLQESMQAFSRAMTPELRRAVQETSEAISRANLARFAEVAARLNEANVAQFSRLAAAIPKPAFTAAQLDVMSNVFDAISASTRERAELASKVAGEALQARILEQSAALRANLFPWDNTRELVDRLRSLPAPVPVATPDQVSAWNARAEAVVEDLSDEERAALEEVEYGLRDFLRDLPSPERRSLTLTLIGLLFATALFIESLARRADTIDAALKLMGCLIALLAIYWSLGNAIDAVEDDDDAT
jgi:hypothetical protein